MYNCCYGTCYHEKTLCARALPATLCTARLGLLEHPRLGDPGLDLPQLVRLQQQRVQVAEAPDGLADGPRVHVAEVLVRPGAAVRDLEKHRETVSLTRAAFNAAPKTY